MMVSIRISGGAQDGGRVGGSLGDETTVETVPGSPTGPGHPRDPDALRTRGMHAIPHA